MVCSLNFVHTKIKNKKSEKSVLPAAVKPAAARTAGAVAIATAPPPTQAAANFQFQELSTFSSHLQKTECKKNEIIFIQTII